MYIHIFCRSENRSVRVTDFMAATVSSFACSIDKSVKMRSRKCSFRSALFDILMCYATLLIAVNAGIKTLSPNRID